MKLDRYTYYARLLPVLIVSAPLVMLILIAFPIDLHLVIISAFMFLMAQYGRDSGKKKEVELFRTIGGKPSTRILRHCDATLLPATKSRYHDFLVANIPRFELPTPQQEASDPEVADKMYGAAVDWLRANTRDTKLHKLLLEENISYGFRRNLWGMKTCGIACCLCSGALMVVLYYYAPLFGILLPSLAKILIICLVIINLLYFWIFVAKPRWVITPAEAYAKTLLDFCDQPPNQTVVQTV